jgi:DNA-binding CsgD family transcriptional regulator
MEYNDTQVANVQLSSHHEGIKNEKKRQPMEFLALSHTRMEQVLYELMFAETRKAMTRAAAFSIRQLMIQTGINNYSSLRRAQIGLVNKMSIERQKTFGAAKSAPVIYEVYSPGEILDRRLKAGFNPFPNEAATVQETDNLAWLIERLVQRQNLSRRQAQVALNCAEGLSNAEIGARLSIRQETVKFHLRNIFVKFGVKRRTELIAHLFQQELTGLTGKRL